MTAVISATNPRKHAAIIQASTKRGHNKLYPSGANVVDKAADEKSSGKKRIGLERRDVGVKPYRFHGGMK
jgi:hypothetical protein